MNGTIVPLAGWIEADGLPLSDALATPDFTPTDGTSDRRGWWAEDG
jgi:hypothetical protein